MLNIEVSEIELRSIISDYIGIPLKYTNNFFVNYKKEKCLCAAELGSYTEKYQHFLEVFNEIKQKDEKL